MIATKRRRDLGAMRHRIAVTNWRERPDDDVNLVRDRKPIFSCAAAIVERNFATSSQVGSYDQGQVNGLNVPTHTITIRNPSDVLITGRHWIYVERRFGQRQWFKVLVVKVADVREDYLDIDVKLDEVDDPRKDTTVLDANPSFEAPDIVGPKYGAL